MCGRFVSASSADTIAEYFGAAFNGESLGENYNVAPTNDIYGVVADPDGSLRLEVFHWGLIPSWAKERKIGAKMINARAETLAEKPAYKSVFRKHRCIIPMDGFYEWKAGHRRRPGDRQRQAGQAADVHPGQDGEPLAVAGTVVGLEGPGGRGRRQVAALGDRGDDVGERHDEPGSRPHARAPAAVAVGRMARPQHARHRPTVAAPAPRRRTTCSRCTP